MKTCDICGTLNLKENDYCTHCGNKFVLEHICPHCGVNNPNHATHCIKCGNQINPISINDFDILFSEYNENLLLNARISDVEYHQLLSNIFARADYVDFYGFTIKEKILSLASVFVECTPKSRGYERGFIFGSRIYYDDRLEDSVQIATIIHELAHYFLFAIIEDLLCSIFKVNTSSTIKSFVWYFLSFLSEFKIINEYCAHTVEGRFIPYGYQNYGSFNVLVENSNIDKDALNSLVVIGNTFANEIIVFLEKYIDDNLRREIKLQYRKDLVSPTYESIFTETSTSWPLSHKNSVLLDLLYAVFKESSNIEARKELESIKERIEH